MLNSLQILSILVNDYPKGGAEVQTYTYQYEDSLSLQIFVEKNKLSEPQHVLVQVYTDEKESHLFVTLEGELRQLIPHARVLPGSPAENDERFEVETARKTVLSFTTFGEISVEELTLQLAYLNHHLRESEQRYRSLFENNPNLIYSMDRNGMILSVNPALIKEIGYLPKEVRGTPAVHYIVESQQAETIEYFRKTLNGEPQYFSIDIKGKDGLARSFQITNVPIFVNDNIVGVYGIGQNITEQKKDREKITRLAYHDSMTGLPNRLLFQQTLEGAMKKAQSERHPMAVMFLDLDRFKFINDSVGHYSGDEILKKAVFKMGNTIEDEHFFSRFNGDEFVLLVPKVKGADEVSQIAHSLLAVLKEPITHEDREFYLSASIGISLFPDDADDGEDLMKNADTALNRAKQQGAGKIQFFEKEMKKILSERFELENDLRRALENDEFLVFYQPQIKVRTGKVYGSEALIRWRHPKLGLVTPGTFIPLAEETGLIHEIGRWVMNTACRQARTWQRNGYHDFSVSVNVSARQFQQACFVGDVRDALTQSGLEPQFLHLELTESITLRDARQSIHHVRALKKLGVKVSIDDFGTGYSSFSYLKDFSIDILKIDRSFVRNLRNGSHDGAIVKAILTMCDGLSVTAVAEGVETKEQLGLLKNYGCHCVQGFLYSQPLPAKIFNRFIRAQNTKAQ